MEVKLNIGYKQLVTIISQLPKEEVNRLKTEIDRISKERDMEVMDDFESFILSGPVMSGEMYDEFKENRNKINQWREN